MQTRTKLTLVILTLIAIASFSIFFTDLKLAAWLQTFYSTLAKPAHVINSVMDERVVLFGSAALFLLFRFCFSSFFFHMLFFHIVITQSLGQTVIRLIKVFVGRARPYMALEHGHNYLNLCSFSSDFHSFPSGHSLCLFIVASSLSYRFPKYTYLFFPLAFILAFTRAILLKHFLSDILISLVLALLLGKLVYHFSYAIVDKKVLNPS